MIIFTHQQSPAEAAQKMVKSWNPIKAIYEQYLTGLKQMVPGQRLPTGETIESEIKRIKKHLKTFK